MSDTIKFIPRDFIEGEKTKVYQENIRNRQYHTIFVGELCDALQDYHMSQNPTAYPELYSSERGRLISTNFEDLLASKHPSESEKNTFPIPIDEEDGYLYIDGLFDEKGNIDNFLINNGFHLDHNTFESGKNTYHKLNARFFNHNIEKYEYKTYFIDMEKKSHFPGLEKGIDNGNNGFVKYVGYFGNQTIMIKKLDSSATVCINIENDSQIGPESQSIKIHKNGSIDILQFNEYINPDRDANDFRMKEPWFLGSDGILYEAVIENISKDRSKNDSAIVLKNSDLRDSNNVINVLYFRPKPLRELNSPIIVNI